MSVTILPYIEDDNKVTGQSRTKAVRTFADTNQSSFGEVLEATKRARCAMAVDAMIAESRSGGVSGDAIQQMLGFRPQVVASVVSAFSDTVSGVGTGNAASAGQADSSNVSVSSSTNTATTSSTASTSTTASGISGCPASLEAYFKEAAATYNIDENLLKAVAKAESGFDPSATSSAGAMGVMQLMPSTAKSLGITNAYNAKDNIMGGARILAQNLSRYDGDLSLALAGYNAGCGNVDKYGGIPPFKETQNYVKKVLSYYQKAQG